VSRATVAKYNFLSFARRGAAADLTGADPLSGQVVSRGALVVSLDVESRADGDAEMSTVPQTMLLYGPGDVTGIDLRHVIRTDPPDGTTNYEPNYFAGIEFDHPDFIWLFTPAAPNGNRLRPWLSLVVLADGEFSVPDVPPLPLPAIDVPDATKLPPLDDAWAWGHVQVAGEVAPVDLAAVFEREPERALSRLLCPRQLAPRTRYTAFLVPAFEFGRLAGLGLEVPERPYPDLPATAAAWGEAESVRLPCYFSFRFQTGALGDFESLVRLLRPRHLDPGVGVRPLDVTQPGWGLPSGGGPLALTGALRALDADTSWAGELSSAFQTALAEHVNRGAATLVDDPSGDPLVEPPLYGRWQAALASVDPGRTQWADELSCDPANRAVAGFGTAVALDQRAQLMTSAWRQVEGILRANELLRQGQLARGASEQLFAKHLAAARDEVRLSLTAAVHERLLAGPRTIAATFAETRLPRAALTPSFRRATRPLGSIRAWQARGRTDGIDLVAGLNDAALRPAPPPRPPAGMTSIEQVAERLHPQGVPQWLRRLVPPRLPPERPRAADATRGGRIAPAAAEAAPPRPGFVLAEPGAPAPPPAPPGLGDSPDAQRFRAAAADLARALQAGEPDPPEPAAADLPGLSATVLEKLRPERTITARLQSLIRTDGIVAVAGADDADPLAEIMAAPEFPQPLSRPLADLSQDDLLPGLDRVPPNTLGLLEENHAFIEAYLVGLNHEFSRQLLFEEFPSDGRGSYFRQFWDVGGYVPEPGDPQDPAQRREQLKDIPPIHRWPLTNRLGENRNRPESSRGALVVLVRGELLRRYPNASIYAVKAIWDAAAGRHALADEERHPLFRGSLLPDVTFFGFALEAEEARGSSDPHSPDQGWFFVLEQHPTEPRFGLEPADGGDAPQVTRWNDLSWANFGSPPFLSASIQPQAVFGPSLDPPPPQQPDNPGDPDNSWGRDAAQTAFILLRRPGRVAVHARAMLPEATT
jgi:hypothetical protein